MRLKAKKKMARMMFAQRFTLNGNVRDRKTITAGITNNTASPKYNH